MDIPELTARLGTIPLFEGVSEDELGRVAAQMTDISFPAGTEIIDEGAPLRVGRMYIILEGTASVTVDGTTVAEFGPGDHFGEMSLLDGGPRTATVTATSDLHLAGLASWHLRPLLLEEPEIAIHIIESLAGRLRQANLQIEQN